MLTLQDFQKTIFRYCLVTWLGMPALLYVLCMLIWPWPNPRSRSWGHRPMTTASFHSGTFYYCCKIVIMFCTVQSVY